MLWVGNPLRTPVVNKHNVHRLCRGACLAEVTGECSRWLACSRTAQHTLEHGKTVVIRDYLLKAYCRNVQFGARCAHVSVAFVGANHDVASLGNAEVGTCHTGICCKELVAQAKSRHISEVCWVVVTRFGVEFLLKQFSHVVVVEVDSRHHDMARLLSLQLNDALAEVGLHHLNAVLLKVWVHLALFCEHRLRLHYFLHAVLTQNTIDNLVELTCVLCPMNDTSVFLRIGCELVKILVQVGYSVTLYLRSFLAQLFPFIESQCHFVSLCAHRPECCVVPRCIFLILQKLLCC